MSALEERLRLSPGAPQAPRSNSDKGEMTSAERRVLDGSALGAGGGSERAVS